MPVAAGAALSDIDHFVLAGAIPDDVPAADPADVVDAVSSLAGRSLGPLRWVGLAPMSNLARIIVEAPEVAARLQVTQMGAAIHCRRPRRAEHNVRLDLDAARVVLDAAAAGGWPGWSWWSPMSPSPSRLLSTPRTHWPVNSAGTRRRGRRCWR